jgi:hypothetical protein
LWRKGSPAEFIQEQIDLPDVDPLSGENTVPVRLKTDRAGTFG